MNSLLLVYIILYGVYYYEVDSLSTLGRPVFATGPSYLLHLWDTILDRVSDLTTAPSRNKFSQGRRMPNATATVVRFEINF